MPENHSPRIVVPAMDRTRPADIPAGVYQPKDELLAFLEAL